ncbi:MAG: oligosaccharide flippase family protein [Geothrix sp.]|nr:oligosaccharide flippase family protein [Geothrix sp.]
MSVTPPAAPQTPQSHYRHLARGFNWLGSATIIAKVIDFSTILVVLLYLTKAQVGIASLVISFGMVVEALDGLGTSEAMIQADAVSRRQLDSLFWFILAVAVAAAGMTLLASPWIEKIYGVPGMATYFLVIAAKQPLVGAAVVPLALLNRELKYERIAAISVFSTVAAALTRLGLAVGGAGAWALVGAFASSGLYILIGTLLFRPFRPRLRFHLPEILPLVRFGLRAATSNIFEQIFKNIDYLLIGGFYGAAQLAVYRVAFDVAMEPAIAVGALVNRTAMPVFARVAQVRDHLAQSLTWSLRRLVVLVAPLMVGLILVARPLMTLLHDGQGHSYAAAALPLELLAGAALLRVSSQLLMPLLLGSGRPGTAARLSAATLALLSAGILAACLIFPARTGIIAVSAVWLGVYPLLLVWGVLYLHRHWEIHAGALGRAFLVPLIGIAAMVAAVAAARALIGGDNLKLQIGITLAAVLLTYAGLFLHARKRPYQLS